MGFLDQLTSPITNYIRQNATPSYWNKFQLPTTTPAAVPQPVDPMAAFFQGQQGAFEQQGLNQLANIRAIGELQAQDQARKDAGNQALQNQLRGPGGSVTPWSSGYFNKSQLANPQLDAAWSQTPEWAKQSSLLTPEGMKNAVGVSQVQNPFNANPQQAQPGITYSQLNEAGQPVANVAFGQDGVPRGFAVSVNPNQMDQTGRPEMLASPELLRSMQQANAPFANWQGLLNETDQALKNPAYKNMFAALLK